MEIPQIVHVKGNLEWVTVEDNGYWIGICEPLDLTLQANTYAELMEDIGLALDALLKELISTGDFDRFMQSNGWTIIEGTYEGVEHFDVPYDVTRRQVNDPTRATYQ